MEISSMENVADETEAYDARFKTAEAYETHGLYNEALVLYKSIVADTPALPEERRRQIDDKIAKLSREIDDEDDQALSHDLSSEEVSHIKTGLSIGESAPEVYDSATAFKELGLYKEAVTEYLKLFETDYNIDDFISDFIDCMITIHPAAQIVPEVDSVIRKYQLDEKKAATMHYVLGNELARRDHRDMAIKSFETVEKLDPTYPKIRETMEAVQPDKRFDSRYDYLLRNKFVTTEQLQKSLSLSKKLRKSVETILMDQFKVAREDIGKSLSAYYKCPFKMFDPNMEIPYELISNLKKPFLLQDIWVPLSWDIDHIEILLDDPRDLRKLDHAKALFNTSKFIFSVGIKEDIEAVINHFFAAKKSKKTAEKAPSKAHEFDEMPEISFEEEDTEEEEDLTEINGESSGKIVRLVDQVIISAYRRNASDIHIEPSPATKRTKIRFRVDGICHEFLDVPNSFCSAIISRIKIMSNLDIAERRMPQDGKIKFKRRGVSPFELRVATLPTADGQEDAVLRLLGAAGALQLEELAMTDRNLTVLKKAISKPYGIVLVVGPTGSGKTTTLHSALHYINTPERKIWTAEDPVEITQYGLRQVEVKNRIGLDFARIMRAFLRADPDVIMVGEMRDFETASIGIEASLTGHLVFSTLHTNSAPETVTRLLDMGLNALNFSDAFLAVLAQRLLRRLCPKCKKAYQPGEEEFNDIVSDYGPEDFKQTGIEFSKDLTFYAPAGCDQCNGVGYKGRMGIHELMEGTKEIKRMIKKQASAEELFIQARKEGMTTLMQDGIGKVFKGSTDMAEVRRVCIA
jgi:type II secretory ATPase GspE/PulE/Tfp pilus assembly ATPase PilB-like protein